MSKISEIVAFNDIRIVILVEEAEGEIFIEVTTLLEPNKCGIK